MRLTVIDIWCRTIKYQLGIPTVNEKQNAPSVTQLHFITVYKSPPIPTDHRSNKVTLCTTPSPIAKDHRSKKNTNLKRPPFAKDHHRSWETTDPKRPPILKATVCKRPSPVVKDHRWQKVTDRESSSPIAKVHHRLLKCTSDSMTTLNASLTSHRRKVSFLQQHL